jgi:DNA (cytosine-5)-methyltransferase 1
MKLWPTPKASNGGPDYAKENRSATGGNLPTAAGGSLNPDWVEWLMGWPTGWTDLKPLAMDKYLSWLQSHSEALRED